MTRAEPIGRRWQWWMVVAMLHTALASAETLLPRDRFSLDAGVFIADYSSELRKSSDERGTNIDLEDVLGLDEDDEMLRFGASYRVRDRHELFVSYMNMDRDAAERIDIEIIYDGVVFPIGTDVETNWDLDIYRGGYTFYPWSESHFELGLTIGIYFLDAAFDMQEENEIITADDSGSSPFPMVWLKGA